MTRLHGRAASDQRLIAKVPHGHWQSSTIISAIRLDGACAPAVFDSSTDTDVFEAYVEQVLLPVLRPGDVVVMDNLQTHKIKRVGELIASAQATLVFLPAYSPDLNPIENMWSKIKTLVRKAEARTFDAIVTAVGNALAKVTLDDCKGYFKHCGYAT
jgi:transposase